MLINDFCYFRAMAFTTFDKMVQFLSIIIITYSTLLLIRCGLVTKQNKVRRSEAETATVCMTLTVAKIKYCILF